MAWYIGLEGCPRRVRAASWARLLTARLLGWARGAASTACGPAFALLSESAAGPGLAARGTTPRTPVPPSAPIFVVRMPDPDGGVAESGSQEGRATAPRVRTDAVAATQKILLQSYDEGLEFPCLMSHWRTWSTFTTFRAEMGMTIQGFSVT